VHVDLESLLYVTGGVTCAKVAGDWQSMCQSLHASCSHVASQLSSAAGMHITPQWAACHAIPQRAAACRRPARGTRHGIARVRVGPCAVPTSTRISLLCNNQAGLVCCIRWPSGRWAHIIAHVLAGVDSGTHGNMCRCHSNLLAQLAPELNSYSLPKMVTHSGQQHPHNSWFSDG